MVEVTHADKDDRVVPVSVKPRPFPVMMDYNGLCQALADEWAALDPVDETRTLLAEAIKAIGILCDALETREEYIRRLYSSVLELKDGIEQHGAEKWMPHRVERATKIIKDLQPHG